MHEEVLKIMPEILMGNDLNQALQVKPAFDPWIRNAPAARRLLALQDIYSVFVPNAMSREIYTRVYLSLMHGLKKKLSINAVRQSNENFKRIHGQEYSSIMGGVESFTVLGESGIGKSEAALELVRRGHRLITDDVVEIRKVSDHTLVGTAPDITRHFIELRGIGIINVKTLFGVEAVMDTTNIDLVIKLEEWDKDKEYDRLGLEEEYTEFLGNRVTCHSLPIRPGRNLAVIVESAAVNHRQKKMGYNAAKELYNRVQQGIMDKMAQNSSE